MTTSVRERLLLLHCLHWALKRLNTELESSIAGRLGFGGYNPWIGRWGESMLEPAIELGLFGEMNLPEIQDLRKEVLLDTLAFCHNNPYKSVKDIEEVVLCSYLLRKLPVEIERVRAEYEANKQSDPTKEAT